MSAKVLSAAVVGLDAKIVEVESDISRGLPRVAIVGLPDMAVQESKERVKSGIKNSGIEFPLSNVTINLAPAHLKKEGPSYDLPIAMSILLKRNEVKSPDDLMEFIFIGELALNGELRSVNGVLPIALLAKEKGIKELYLPISNAYEASLVKGIKIMPVRSLEQLVKHFNGQEIIKPFKSSPFKRPKIVDDKYDMSYIKGQEQAKRALEIAAAGAHNILFTGPPGSGKTLLARSMATILPSISFDEAIEVTKIYSVAGQLSKDSSIIFNRPFRSPHHTTSSVALVGGGSSPRPGEISLAHRGVLFLDEFSEFSRAVLESLRQPLEDGVITISRAAGAAEFPARFILVAARNPCPCGFFNDSKQACTCNPYQIVKYQRKISGPLLDRIDLHITVPRVNFEKMFDQKKLETSETIRQRVEYARVIQRKRFSKYQFHINAEMSSRDIAEFCHLDEEAKELLKNAVNQFYLSSRAYHRILKVAKTIADLDNEDNISVKHIAESLKYRTL